MNFIISETLLPWLPSGATSKNYICPTKKKAINLVRNLMKQAMKDYSFKREDIINLDSLIWEEDTGYLETDLGKEQPYSSWSVTWSEEDTPYFDEDVDDFFEQEE